MGQGTRAFQLLLAWELHLAQRTQKNIWKHLLRSCAVPLLLFSFSLKLCLVPGFLSLIFSSLQPGEHRTGIPVPAPEGNTARALDPVPAALPEVSPWFAPAHLGVPKCHRAAVLGDAPPWGTHSKKPLSPTGEPEAVIEVLGKGS